VRRSNASNDASQAEVHVVVVVEVAVVEIAVVEIAVVEIAVVEVAVVEKVSALRRAETRPTR
jgi:hypothetical protein